MKVKHNMNNYQLRLLLNALCQVYSLEELEDGRTITSSLIRYLYLTPEAVGALLYGACQLKRLRSGGHTESFSALIEH